MFIITIMRGGATPLTQLAQYDLLHELVFNRANNVYHISSSSSYGIVYGITLPENVEPLHIEYGQPIRNYVLKIALINPDEDYEDDEEVQTPPDDEENINKRVMRLDEFTQEIVTQNFIWNKTSTRGNPVCPSVIDEGCGVFAYNFPELLLQKYPDLAPSMNLVLQQSEEKHAYPAFMLMNLIRGRPLHVVHHLPQSEISFYNLSLLYQRIFVKAMRLCLECNILHEDLHSNNILVDDNLNPFLIDFGRVRRIVPDSNVFTTRYYDMVNNNNLDADNIVTYVNDFCSQFTSASMEFEYILNHLVRPFDNNGNLNYEDEDLEENEISEYHAIRIWELLRQELQGVDYLMHGGKKSRKCKSKSKKR